MRTGLISMLMLCSISNIARGQQWQTVFSIDSRAGYSSNTYLNPYFSEWDRSVNGGYGTISALSQTTWFNENNSVELIGGLVFEPFFGNRKSWKGGLGLFNYNFNFSSNLSIGIEGGGSYFSSSFDRALFWVQPAISWSPTLFTNIKIRAGSNYRQYENYMLDSISVDSKNRTDLYAIEVETWPSFRWQFKAGLYGNLDVLPSITKGFSSIATMTRIFGKGGKAHLSFGIDHYQNQESITTTGGGNSFPPIGGGSMGTTNSETIRYTDQILRLGLGASYPVSNRLSLMFDLEGLQYQSSQNENNVQDIQVSGGIRLTIRPPERDKNNSVTIEWSKATSQQTVKIRYSGSGQLYLIGDFNNWERPGIPLVEQENNLYVAQLNLQIGSYEYKVLNITGEEEQWLPFSRNTYTVKDGYGGENAMLFIEK